MAIAPHDLNLRQRDIHPYVRSPGYSYDLAATQAVWSRPEVTATAGVYVFLLYLSVPALLSVRSRSGLLARPALDGERERTFLMNITGCAEGNWWGGGIKNPRVYRQANLLGLRHARFPGMRPDYLDFIGTVVTLAPLRAQTGLDASTRGRYWRYMNHATLLLGADIGEEAGALGRCLTFIDTHAAPSSEGRRLYASLQACHPRYVERAMPLLPAQAGVIIGDLMQSTP